MFTCYFVDLIILLQIKSHQTNKHKTVTPPFWEVMMSHPHSLTLDQQSKATKYISVRWVINAHWSTLMHIKCTQNYFKVYKGMTWMTLIYNSSLWNIIKC